MAKTYNKMLIDVNEEIDGIITEVQADQNSRYLDIYLYNNGVPIDLADHTVRIYMRRPKTDPLEEFFNDGEITEETNGRCQFLLTTQALAKEGYLEAQITIWKGAEELLSTHMFKIKVVTNIMSEGSVESSNEYGALVVLFQNLYEAYDLMVTMVQNIGVPAEVAAQYDLETMWQAWEFLVAYMKGDFTNKVDEAIANASVKAVLDLIGEITDTGGSETAGTIMAKLNGLFKQTSITAQTKEFTEIVSGTIGNSDATSSGKITGKGRIIFYRSSGATVKIDGITVPYNKSLNPNAVEFFFNESVEVTTSVNNFFYYFVQS